jgi:hypothetical protein
MIARLCCTLCGFLFDSDFKTGPMLLRPWIRIYNGGSCRWTKYERHVSRRSWSESM